MKSNGTTFKLLRFIFSRIQAWEISKFRQLSCFTVRRGRKAMRTTPERGNLDSHRSGTSHSKSSDMEFLAKIENFDVYFDLYPISRSGSEGKFYEKSNGAIFKPLRLIFSRI